MILFHWFCGSHFSIKKVTIYLKTITAVLNKYKKIPYKKYRLMAVTNVHLDGVIWKCKNRLFLSEKVISHHQGSVERCLFWTKCPNKEGQKKVNVLFIKLFSLYFVTFISTSTFSLAKVKHEISYIHGESHSQHFRALLSPKCLKCIKVIHFNTFIPTFVAKCALRKFSIFSRF